MTSVKTDRATLFTCKWFKTDLLTTLAEIIKYSNSGIDVSYFSTNEQQYNKIGILLQQVYYQSATRRFKHNYNQCMYSF